MDIIMPRSSGSSKVGRHYGYNMQSGLANYKAALANYATQKAVVNCYGTSLTNGNNSSDKWSKGWPSLLHARLQTKYGDAGSGISPGDTATLSYPGGGWNYSAYSGGYACTTVITTSGTVTGTATGSFRGTNIDIMYRKRTDGGTATVTVDGVNKGTINCSGGSGAYTDFNNNLQISGLSSGTHAVIITPNGDGVMEICSIFSYNASGGGIIVNRCGAPGSSAIHWNRNEVKVQWDYYTPNLVILDFGANEAHFASYSQSSIAAAISTYKTNLDALIKYWKGRGVDVMLIPWFRPADAWSNFWPEIVKAQYDLADANNCALVDLYQAFGMSYELNSTIFQNLGATPDQIHPVDSGYLQVSRILEPHLVL